MFRGMRDLQTDLAYVRGGWGKEEHRKKGALLPWTPCVFLLAGSQQEEELVKMAHSIWLTCMHT